MAYLVSKVSDFSIVEILDENFFGGEVFWNKFLIFEIENKSAKELDYLKDKLFSSSIFDEEILTFENVETIKNVPKKLNDFKYIINHENVIDETTLQESLNSDIILPLQISIDDIEELDEKDF